MCLTEGHVRIRTHSAVRKHTFAQCVFLRSRGRRHAWVPLRTARYHVPARLSLCGRRHQASAPGSAPHRRWLQGIGRSGCAHRSQRPSNDRRRGETCAKHHASGTTPLVVGIYHPFSTIILGPNDNHGTAPFVFASGITPFIFGTYHLSHRPMAATASAGVDRP